MGEELMIRPRIRAAALKQVGLPARRPAGTINYAFNGEHLPCRVHHRREPILHLNPGAVRRTYEILQRSSPSMLRGDAHLFIDAAPVETGDQLGECEALVRQKSMRVVASDLTTTGAQEFHRPLRVITPSVGEAADIAHQAFECGPTIDAREGIGKGIMERGSHDTEI